MRLGEHDEVQDIRDELAGLRAELEAVRTRPTIWRRAVTRVRAARRLTVVGIVALMLAVPVAVSAGHVFSDVPTSSTYHTTVARLVGAGITGGCGAGKYCPNAAVTRGQMAAFLNRGLGRAISYADVTVDDHWATLLPSGSGFLSDVYLLSGGGTGGTAHVLVTANMSAYTNEPGICPCEFAMALISELGEVSIPVYTMIGGDASPADGEFRGAMSVSHLFTVPSGTLVGFAIITLLTPTLAPSPDPEFHADAFYSIQAAYVPFDGLGENPPAPVVTAGDNLPFGTWPFGDR